jgi:ribosomal protein S12
MDFAKTILKAFKHWTDTKFAKVQSDIESKQPIGDYALKKDIPEVNYPVTSVNKQTGDVDLNWDNLSDKPFSEFIPEVIMSDVVITSQHMTDIDDAKPLLHNKQYTFIINGVSYVKTMATLDATTSIVSVAYDGGHMTIRCYIYSDFRGSYTVEMATPGTTLTILDGVKEIIQLDEKFIPDTIARVKDIPEVAYPVTSVNGQTGDVVIDVPTQI